MPATFSVGPLDVLIWIVAGGVGGFLGGMVVRGGATRPADAVLGMPFALLGGVATEWFGMRESGESVAAAAIAFFASMLLTALLRLLPGRLSA